MANVPNDAAADLSLEDRSNEDGEGLDTVVHVRLKRREKVQLQATAQLAGLTVSGLIRRRCLGHKVALAPNPALAEDLRRAGEQVRRLEEESQGCYRERTAAILDTLRGAINRLGAGY